MTEEERRHGVVAVSGGNHGIAVAVMAAALGVAATVVMPQSAPEDSIGRARAAGARVELTDGMPAAFARVDELRTEGLVLVHPFDDEIVVAGQGTVGLELAEDAGQLTDVLVSVGGGGLIAGVAVALKGLRPELRIWGVEPEGARALTDAIGAGRPVPATLSSMISTLSAPQVSQLTLQHAALLEDVLLVSDRDCVAGTLQLADRAKVWIEPADGSLLPAARQVLDRVGPKARLGFVLSGGNATTYDVRRWADRFGL
ncbi:pyridoxal-phosphate dependent enzyme [Microlunatus sp. Gsoil 973]|uniref:pyridoxal-phosphate dependent enzyme n=1 Tax=Microlunatus sp. Gsoil 973 TaxID=2672569 RepID=UPI001E4E7B7A|nr:pyridoxal-phosphate dependent enzyme [Microlunatus sp. Gsoil 973]